MKLNHFLSRSQFNKHHNQPCIRYWVEYTQDACPTLKQFIAIDYIWRRHTHTHTHTHLVMAKIGSLSPLFIEHFYHILRAIIVFAINLKSHISSNYYPHFMYIKPKGKRLILYHTLIVGETFFESKYALQKCGPLWLCCLALGKTVIGVGKKDR